MCNFDNNYLNYGAKFAPNIKLIVQTADIYTAAEKGANNVPDIRIQVPANKMH
jgi:hypothetical protein